MTIPPSQAANTDVKQLPVTPVLPNARNVIRTTVVIVPTIKPITDAKSIGTIVRQNARPEKLAITETAKQKDTLRLPVLPMLTAVNLVKQGAATLLNTINTVHAIQVSSI